MKKELTLQKAYELAVKKWEYIVGHNGSQNGLSSVFPEMDYFKAECSYCQMFFVNDNMNTTCGNCPLLLDKEFEDEGLV